MPRLPLFLALLLGACATVPAATPDAARAALARSTASLGAFAADLADPEAAADPALALADADAALAALLLAGLRAAPADRPALAMLAGIVAACRHGAARASVSAERPAAARALAAGCLQPLAAAGY